MINERSLHALGEGDHRVLDSPLNSETSNTSRGRPWEAIAKKQDYEGRKRLVIQSETNRVQLSRVLGSGLVEGWIGLSEGQ